MRRDKIGLQSLLLSIIGFGIILSACEPLEHDGFLNIGPNSLVINTASPQSQTPSAEALATPIVVKQAHFGARIEVPESFFSVQPVSDYLPDIPLLQSGLVDGRVVVNTPDNSFFYSFSGNEALQFGSSQACLDAVTKKMTEDWQELSVSPEASDELPADTLRVSFHGKLLERATRGTLVIRYQNQRCYSFMGLYPDTALGEAGEGLDAEVGDKLFDEMLRTIVIKDQPPEPTCRISEDPTYGMIPENPIQVGNTTIRDGKDREERYLLTLRGPNGEEILFSRDVPMFNLRGEIVDVYRVEYTGIAEPVSVYFDIYHFAEPLALRGYTCEAPFPLEQP